MKIKFVVHNQYMIFGKGKSILRKNHLAHCNKELERREK